jgi:hypothetical protein
MTDSNNNKPSLNIPSAKQVYDLRHSRELENENQLVQKQQQLIEKAFSEFSGDQEVITLELDEKLRDTLIDQLHEKGYSVFQKCIYRSNDNSTHNGKWKVSISPESFNYDMINIPRMFRRTYPFWSPMYSLQWF